MGMGHREHVGDTSPRASIAHPVAIRPLHQTDRIHPGSIPLPTASSKRKRSSSSIVPRPTSAPEWTLEELSSQDVADDKRGITSQESPQTNWHNRTNQSSITQSIKSPNHGEDFLTAVALTSSIVLFLVLTALVATCCLRLIRASESQLEVTYFKRSDSSAKNSASNSGSEVNPSARNSSEDEGLKVHMRRLTVSRRLPQDRVIRRWVSDGDLADSKVSQFLDFHDEFLRSREDFATAEFPRSATAFGARSAYTSQDHTSSNCFQELTNTQELSGRSSSETEICSSIRQKVLTLSLSQMSMNIRSCPESPLAPRGPLLERYQVPQIRHNEPLFVFQYLSSLSEALLQHVTPKQAPHQESPKHSSRMSRSTASIGNNNSSHDNSSHDNTDADYDTDHRNSPRFWEETN